MLLYADHAPYRTHALPVSHGHMLHVEERGQPEGVAALVLHGGPGSGSSPLLSRFFDPARYRVISADQRGAGRSTPRGSIEHNTTADLVDDLEALRRQLGIETWLVVGGSWGATLSLAYAVAHPHAVKGLLLRAVFLARAEDTARFFQYTGARHAAAWQRFAEVAPAENRSALLPFLAQGLASGPLPAARRLAVAWWRWECELAGRPTPATHPPEPNGEVLDALVDRYRVQAHYLTHHCWLDTPPLLARLAALPRVPTLLLHSRDDAICPPEGAVAAHQNIPHSELRWVDGAGHDPSHPAMASAMVEALDAFASHGHFGPPTP
jgi:proline iminopeptidase